MSHDRICITDDCFGIVRGEGEHCRRCAKVLYLRERSRKLSEQQSAWLNWRGPMRDGLPLWRETEPGPLIASMGREVNWHPELRMVA